MKAVVENDTLDRYDFPTHGNWMMKLRLVFTEEYSVNDFYKVFKFAAGAIDLARSSQKARWWARSMFYLRILLSRQHHG